MYYYFILCIVGDNVGAYDKHKHICHLLFFSILYRYYLLTNHITAL